MRILDPGPARTEFDLTPLASLAAVIAVFLWLIVGVGLRVEDQKTRLSAAARVEAPPVGPRYPVALEVTREGTIVMGGLELADDGVGQFFQTEREVFRLRGISPSQATVVLQADGRVATGKVQRLIEIGQGCGFERFVLCRQGARR